MRSIRWLIPAALATLVTACTPDDDEFGGAGDGYPADAGTIVRGVDWSDAKELVIESSEFKFTPDALTFQTGQPYALTLVNGGALPHTFAAKGFFRAIAAKSLLYSDGEAGFPQLESVSLAANESKTLFFVPLTPGRYELTCTEPLHATFGMVGQIEVR